MVVGIVSAVREYIASLVLYSSSTLSHRQITTFPKTKIQSSTTVSFMLSESKLMLIASVSSINLIGSVKFVLGSIPNSVSAKSANFSKVS